MVEYQESVLFIKDVYCVIKFAKSSLVLRECRLKKFKHLVMHNLLKDCFMNLQARVFAVKVS